MTSNTKYCLLDFAHSYLLTHFMIGENILNVKKYTSYKICSRYYAGMPGHWTIEEDGNKDYEKRFPFPSYILLPTLECFESSANKVTRIEPKSSAKRNFRVYQTYESNLYELKEQSPANYKLLFESLLKRSLYSKLVIFSLETSEINVILKDE